MSRLRYAILAHEGIRDPHVDLLFETAAGSMLAAWRAPRWPLSTGDPLTPLPDHRPLYLDYEGPLSGQRGAVRRLAAGSHIVVSDQPLLLAVRLDDGTLLHLCRA